MSGRLWATAPSNTLQGTSTCWKTITRGKVAARQMSSTSPLHRKANPTRLRRQMYQWLHTTGSRFKQPQPGVINYLSAANKGRSPRLDDSGGSEADATSESDLKPFPSNPSFSSEPVLGEEQREAIWSAVMIEGQSVSAVSVQHGVTLERVGAVVRLKEIEKEWERTRKPLASAYARAVLEMLPKTPYDPKSARRKTPHESINDLPVHPATMYQIFHPTSESRRFTRADAATVFDKRLKPADYRVPHPELALLERERLAGVPYDERMAAAERRAQAQQDAKKAREAKRKALERKALTVVENGRYQFHFKDISVDDVGKDGRGLQGVGARYGIPHEDRKRGQVKIPTSV